MQFVCLILLLPALARSIPPIDYSLLEIDASDLVSPTPLDQENVLLEELDKAEHSDGSRIAYDIYTTDAGDIHMEPVFEFAPNWPTFSLDRRRLIYAAYAGSTCFAEVFRNSRVQPVAYHIYRPNYDNLVLHVYSKDGLLLFYFQDWEDRMWQWTQHSQDPCALTLTFGPTQLPVAVALFHAKPQLDVTASLLFGMEKMKDLQHIEESVGLILVSAALILHTNTAGLYLRCRPYED